MSDSNNTEYQLFSEMSKEKQSKDFPNMQTRKKRGVMPKGTPFSKQNQPSSKLKSDGWSKRKRGIALVKTILALQFKGLPNSQIKKNVAKQFGIPENDITVEDLMHLRQVEKSITQADTPAYKAVRESAGYKTEFDISGEVDHNIKTKLKDLPIESLKQLVKILDKKK